MIRNHSDHVALAQKDARLTALEAENERWNEKYAALHARFAQQQTKLEQAEAELAALKGRRCETCKRPIRAFAPPIYPSTPSSICPKFATAWEPEFSCSRWAEKGTG